VAVGRLKDGPEAALVSDYLRRLTWPASVVEIDPNKHRGPEAEARALAAATPPGAVRVVLDEKGRDLSSAALAALIGDWRDGGRRDIAFLIGGADGHAERTRRQADLMLAFGRATWPHRLARAMLAEQIYRCHQILAGHPYHRDG